MMLYTCTHMATVGVKGLGCIHIGTSTSPGTCIAYGFQ